MVVVVVKVAVGFGVGVRAVHLTLWSREHVPSHKGTATWQQAGVAVAKIGMESEKCEHFSVHFIHSEELLLDIIFQTASTLLYIYIYIYIYNKVEAVWKIISSSSSSEWIKWTLKCSHFSDSIPILATATPACCQVAVPLWEGTCSRDHKVKCTARTPTPNPTATFTTTTTTTATTIQLLLLLLLRILLLLLLLLQLQSKGLYYYHYFNSFYKNRLSVCSSPQHKSWQIKCSALDISISIRFPLELFHLMWLYQDLFNGNCCSVA